MDIVFTPAAILDLLNQIDELAEYNLGISETLDGKLQLVVGDSVYEITPEQEVEVDEEVIETIEEINTEAYGDLIDEEGFDIEETEPVEAGIIKEALKSMLLGGAIRLAGKLLKE